VLACAGLVAYELFTFRKDLVADVSSVAEIIGYNSARRFRSTTPAPPSKLAGVEREAAHRSACIYDRDGRVFATYLPRHAAADFAPPPTGAIERFQTDHLDLFRPIAVAGNRSHDLLARRPRDHAGALLRYALILGAVLVVAIFVAYLIGSRLQRVISVPIADLLTVTRRVALDQDYTIRAVKRSDDELAA